MKVLHVGSDNKVVLCCPGCEKSKTVDVSKFLGGEGAVDLSFRFRCESCDCGHKSCDSCEKNSCSHGYRSRVRLERRINMRKDTTLTGNLLLTPTDTLSVQVLDLSRKGARIRIPGKIELETGRRVQLEFELDDKNLTRVKKTAEVVRKAGFITALSFMEVDSYSSADKAIGFYLMKTE